MIRETVRPEDFTSCFFPIRHHALFLSAFFLSCLLMFSAADAAIPRQAASVGVIAGATGDAEIRFVNEVDWRLAELCQDLLTGDGLQTGDLGSMALVFHDKTQIRVHRNSSLIVKAVSKDGNEGQSVFKLNHGGVWARSPRGGAGVSIETPSATAAIRGTDWSLTVNKQGRTTLIVLAGDVVLQNAMGRVTVTRGEIAFAEIGKAPRKTILVAPSDRSQLYYDMSLSDAMHLFKISGLKTKDRRLARQAIESVPEGGRSPIQWLDLAELAYDMGDMPMAFRCLTACPRNAETIARMDFISGYLSVFKNDFTIAIRLFENAEPGLDPDRLTAARIGRAGALLLARQTDAAKALIRLMERQTPDAPRFLMFKVILAAFSGDLASASKQASACAKRFPGNPHFPALKGLLAILLDQPEEAKNTARMILSIDPEDAIAYKIQGHYLSDYRHDSEGAVEAVQKGLSFNKNNADLWGTLGWIYMGMGEIRKCEDALKHALSLDPSDMADLFNYLIVLLDQHRMMEASEILAKMTAIDPGRDFLLTGQGRFALQTGQVTQAKEFFLNATAVNPLMTQSSLGLAIAAYQDGDPDLARQILDNAARMDPNDPDIPLTAAAMSMDQAEADSAITYAREAILRYRLIKGTGISELAATRGGDNTLGAAFGNLSLTSWADYYNELSFDPYSAESHFSRALHGEDAYSSLYQGLLLDPLACSARNRYMDFFRRPFTDAAISAFAGDTGEGFRHGETANLQGFSQSFLPVSYYVNIETDNSPGFREDNDETRSATGSAFSGFNLSPYDRMLIDVNATDQTKGMPGTILLPDKDDETREHAIQAGLGYSHSFSARNIFMGRILGYQTETCFKNRDPLGTNLSLIDYSLISNFGVEDTQILHDMGLIDFTTPDDPNSPILVLGGGDTLPNTIPVALDTKTGSRVQIKSENLSMQMRHMVTLDRVDLSWGAEAMTLNTRYRMKSFDFKLLEPGIGTIIGPAGSLNFQYGEPGAAESHSNHDGYGANTHVNALWRLDRRFWMEAGIYGVTYDDDNDTNFSEADPRAGVAWQPNDRNWLRLIYREDTRMPSLATLAPVATVGITGTGIYMANGGHGSQILTRWDREWIQWFFTSLEAGRRKISGFSISGVDNSLDSFTASRGQIDYASISANCWLKGGFGLYGEAVFRDTENISGSVPAHTGLPLIPAQSYRTGVTWIHSAQVRLDLVGNIICKRPEDLSAQEDLKNYGTVDFLSSWQPLNKYLKLGFAIHNIFDADYDLSKNMPGPGRNYLASLEARF